MNIPRLEKFRDVRKRFDFKLYSDGVAFTAQFTKPVYESNQVRPQDVELLDGDETFYADPGRSQCFTAMKGISNNQDAAQITKLSNGEYRHISCTNSLELKRHELKMRNFNDRNVLEARKVQLIESNMPSKKTMVIGRYLEYMEYIRDHCTTLTDFYDERFNNFKLYGYSGRQRALADVSY